MKKPLSDIPRLFARRSVIACALSALLAALVTIPANANQTPCEKRPLESAVMAAARDWPSVRHPLVSTILIDGRPVSDDQRAQTRCGGAQSDLEVLQALIASGQLILLGEVHDNQTHHQLRAALIQKTKAIAFEQIRADQQPALDAFASLPAETRTTADLTRLIDWDKTPWSKTANYIPLFDAAVASKRPIFAADPPRDLIRASAKTGPSALPPEERTRLGLDMPLSDAQNAASLAEIEGSHCGMIPKSAHPNMAFAQRYRDAHMADTLLKAANANGSAVLIAGNGHVRADRGVPWYLRQRAPDKKLISVLFVEVEGGKTDPAQYIERDDNGKPIADVIVFTPRVPRDKDPCTEMKSKFKKD